jgi:hypothetical protein
MTESDVTSRSKRSITPLMIVSHDHSRPDPLDGQSLYVLGFGVTGAILVNTILLIYFLSLYASV